MISSRRLRADLQNLSNGVLYYPVLIAFAWLAYNSTFSNSSDRAIQVVSPLLALFAGSLATIATERQDKVADRITIELGGRRDRLLTRMLSLSITNSLLVGMGLFASFIQHGTLGTSTAITIASSLLAICTVSTLGVLVSSYMPHPLIALVITFLLLSWGGSDPDQNWGLSHLLALLRSENSSTWLKAAANFISPWLLAAGSLIVLSFIRPSIHTLGKAKLFYRRLRRIRIPRWLNNRRGFAKTVFVGAITNPLPMLALVICLALYSFGTINLAAKFATFSLGANLFAVLPGILFANVLPALVFAGSAQRRDITDQESLIYRSQRQAKRAQALQLMSFSAATLIGTILIMARLVNVQPTEPVVARSILWALILSPGLTIIGVELNRAIRLPLISGLVSYLLTLPEIFLAKIAPETRPYLPSSLFSILAGGESSYTKNLPTPAVVAAYVLGILLVIVPLVSFWKTSSQLEKEV